MLTEEFLTIHICDQNNVFSQGSLVQSTGRINLGGESKRAALATTEVPLSKAINPQLLQWSCSVANRSGCGCSF